ncbi:DUF4160 domain-containing protein [Pseudooceanicola marinus]|uniref:DUF4160 domain-containing protein n=1 Tax=Pseudooceanicola marinus TaxID=396013 RepID=UPI0012FE0D08|nr:DUF4160 domain-containing protein [Pseudooceanicola marinus]
MSNPVVLEVPETMAAELRRSVAIGQIVEISEDGNHRYYITDAVVDRVRGLKIEIYANEHPPPHFHVIQNDGRAVFALDDCRMLEASGDIRNFRKNIEVYYAKNRNKLIDFWNNTRPDGCSVGPLSI